MPCCRCRRPLPPGVCCSVHQGAGIALNPPYTMEQMQCYIKYARAIKPHISTQVGSAARGGGAQQALAPATWWW